MQRESRSWVQLLLAALLTAVIIRLDLAAGVPYIGARLEEPGMGRWLAVLMLAVAVWVLVAVLFRVLAGGSGRSIGRRLRQLPDMVSTFWLPAILAIPVAGIIAWLDLAAQVPFVGDLLDKPGAPGLIAAAVLAITIWTLVGIVLRLLMNADEMEQSRQLEKRLRRLPMGSSADLVERELWTVGRGYEQSLVYRRLQLIRDQGGDVHASDRDRFLVSARSGVDVARRQAAFGPLRALVWSLPAFGFLGTATEMSNAVGGLGGALSRTQDYDDLRNLLVSEVVPPLAGAFDLTLFALGSSVLCYVLLALVHEREEEALIEADALSLEILSRLPDPRPARAPAPSPPLPSHVLDGDVDALAERISELNQELRKLVDGGGVGQLVPRLVSIDRHLTNADATLQQIRSGLDRDMVISRAAPARDGRGGTPP